MSDNDTISRLIRRRDSRLPMGVGFAACAVILWVLAFVLVGSFQPLLTILAAINTAIALWAFLTGLLAHRAATRAQAGDH